MSEHSRIYLDHAATSWPKPDAVLNAVDQFSRHCGAAAGRGSYRSAIEAGQMIETVRRSAAALIGAEAPRDVTLQTSCTAALNTAFHGLLRPGDHVVTTAAEHNSVLRPLHFLESHRALKITVVSCDANGLVDVEALLGAVEPTTRMVALTHASNVTGAVQPIAELALRLTSPEVIFVCDAAQTFGYLPINVQQMGIDILAAPGHKGGNGPLGTALLYVAPHLHDELIPLVQGGTGSDSDSLEMPSTMPSKLEAGILNAAALAGWQQGLAELSRRQGDEDTMADRHALATQLRAGLSAIAGLRVIGNGCPTDNRTGGELPIVSLQVDGLAPSDVATILDVEFGIEVRSGLHCAALIHRYLGTEPEGTVRISAGHATTNAEIQAVIDALKTITGTTT